MCAVLWYICDALSHSDDVTSFQGVVQHGQICHNCIRLDGSVWRSKNHSLLRSETDFTYCRRCVWAWPWEAFKWVRVIWRRQRAPCAIWMTLCLVVASLFSDAVSAACTSSPHCGSWNNAWSFLCVKVVQYVFCECERTGKGGGAGNFPLLAAATAAAGSFRTDRGISSIRLSSPSCSALRLGGADNTDCQPNWLGGAKGNGRWGEAF